MERWKINLAVLWVGTFLTLAGMSMIIPFISLYVQELGVTDPKEVSVWAGLIFSANFVTAFILQPVWGKLSDRYGRKIMLLRSGRERRAVMPLRTFEHTWARSGHWAFVALAPGRLPASAGEAEVTRALVAFERVAPPEAALQGYLAALQHWPGNVTLAMGRGNTLYAAGRKREAAEAFRAIAQAHQHGAAWVNLGWVLLELGEVAQAAEAARQAVALGGHWRDQAQALLRRVEAARQPAS